MAKARQHHFVQARYLDGFLASGDTQLYCYGRGRSKFHRSAPDGAATQRDFYAIPNGPPGANIERYLESKIEKPGLEALRRLVERRCEPSVVDRINLSRYIAYQEMRVPYSREMNREHMLRSFEDMSAQFKKTGKSSLTFQHVALAEGVPVKYSKPYEVSPSEIEEYLADMKANPNTFDLDQMVDLANDMTKFYVSMDWTVLLSKSTKAFVTSDCPVFRQFDQPAGDNALLRPDCSVCCPLSGRAFLVMRADVEYLKVAAKEGIEGNGHTLPSTKFRSISDQGVANFNLKIASYANKWCFTGTEDASIFKAMQGPNLRSKPDLFSKSGGTFVRWGRDQEP